MRLKFMGRSWGRKSSPPVTVQQLGSLLAPVDGQSRPNLNALAIAAADISPMALSIKQFGYELARTLAVALPPAPGGAPSPVPLAAKISTQADIESEWVRYWCGQLGIPVVYHRKLWELSYVLQAIHDGGFLREGARGLGFGCGEEPIPSYLAAHGVAVTATDLPPTDAEARGWIDTHQHAATLDQAFSPHLVDRAAFDRLVSLRHVDMNAIPADLAGYDFCWSICALEHVGSIAQGLAFIEQAMATLKPGGIAVHTTEFNIRADGPTIDNWPTVLFQRRHFEELAARLEAAGHDVAPFDFGLGDKPLDRFVDVPPWSHDLPEEMKRWLGEPAHLKLAISGFIATCFGLVVRKAAGPSGTEQEPGPGD